MADNNKPQWDVWRELDDLRQRHKELGAMFARIGVAPEFAQMANNLRLDLQRKPPTTPLATGERDKDAQAQEDYKRAFASHYEEVFFKVESFLRMPWPEETKFLVPGILHETENLRRALVRNPLVSPPLEKLDELIEEYSHLDNMDERLDRAAIEARRLQLIDVLGFPLMVRRQLAHPEWDLLPPLASDDYRQLLASKIGIYRQTDWLISKLFDKWYVALEFDAIWARLKRDANDRERIISQLKLNWPKLGNWAPDFPHADLVWYLLLVLGCVIALFTEWWWTAGALLIWLQLSVIIEKHHAQLVNKRRQALLLECGRFKRIRDQISSGKFDPSLVLRQLKQFNFRHYVSDQGMSLLQSMSMQVF
ncbi:hypothetical protein [Chitinimonas sp. BJB300]|uniref:hypothetical protein n=1 Tax=Chitinimonas sp. BJB300 TaxID=1559339 RepID=UPI000C11AA3F|nr:hypothetical protein [Chitinimonas sp. BJB300]PHV10226.1 hypothetical protein CSQ89_17395 [Chitinimonas sp. BJB300]TSJ89968.1 hypothetical protein FG002_007195 [Chitinimonas sp. BJB300]